MTTLSQLKGAEQNLKKSLQNEKCREFAADIVVALMTVRARIKLAERKAGVRGVPLWTKEFN